MVKIDTLQRSDVLFDREIKKIIGERMARGLDIDLPRKQASRSLIERKIIKHSLWEKLKEDLKIAKFIPENRKGQTFGMMPVFNWINVMIIAFMAIILFAGLIYVMGIINTTMHGVGLQNEVNSGSPGYTNMTAASDATFGAANNGIQGLRLVALTLIFSMIMGTVIVNFLVKIHPLWFFTYILIIGLCIMLSAPISNAYGNIASTNTFDGILPSFIGAHWMMLNLPIIVAIFGILGGVFLFINIVRGGESDSLV